MVLRDRICISPQCGFASVAEGNPITPEVRLAKVDQWCGLTTVALFYGWVSQEQRAKLELVVALAKKCLE